MPSYNVTNDTRSTPEQDLENDSWSRVIFRYIKNAVTFAITLYILVLADVFGAMTKSQRVLTNVLYASYVCYSVFGVIGVYLTLFVGRKNPNWENTHMNYIYVASGAVALGGVLWTVAMWPVFHMWTIPLGLAAMFCVLSLLTFLPGGKAKAD